LGYEPHAFEGRSSGNSRNGKGKEEAADRAGEVPIEVPHAHRNGTFEPKLVKKHQTRFTGFDDKILSMYARGMSARDIQAHLREMYGTDSRRATSRTPRARTWARGAA
jgi:putative transposase